MAKNISAQFTNLQLNSAATTNATLVKAGVCKVRQVILLNASAGIKYVRFYDKVTAPVVGTDTPVFVLAIPATSSKELILPDDSGLLFKLGLGISITGAAALLDATAVAAGDVQAYINLV